jgi:hypothetical protein
VGGDVASLHHNLLAHCEGRNWSLGGGLDSQNNFAGRLDIRNNVVYNWRGRTTDGGAMEVNFVNNYYKPGAATTLVPWALTMNHEDNFGGSQRCYFAGNIMQGYFNESTQTTGRRSVVDAGVPTPAYETFVSAPFFEHYVATQTATGAYKRVLSDVGANRPIDDHDARIIHETLTGSYTYTGTGPYGGFPGLPNSQDDVGGWESYPVETRAAGFDTDEDGLPNWWEDLVGTTPSSAPGDFSDANADPENDGFTRLCDYLAWLALPRVETTAGVPADLDLSPLTKGYTASPLRTVQVAPSSVGAGSVVLTGDGKTARFTPAPGFAGIARLTHTVTDSAGDSMTGDFVVRVLSEPDAYGQFVLANDLDPGTTGATTADPDHDGLANALEFLLGGNPNLSGSTSKGPAGSRAPGGGFNYSYDRNTAAAGLFGDVVETSTNLTSWTPAIPSHRSAWKRNACLFIFPPPAGFSRDYV